MSAALHSGATSGEGQRVTGKRMGVALITNCAPPYRVPLFERLAESLDVELYFHGRNEVAEDRVAADDLDSAPFPAQRLASQLGAFRIASRHRAVICGLSGRVALPAAFLGAKRYRVPFVLWASLWEHPRTPLHLLSALPMHTIYRRADAVVTYGPHVSAYVRRWRGHDGVFEAPQAVDSGVLGREVSAEEQREVREKLNLGDGPVVLFVGRLVEEKGLHSLIDAWQMLDKQPEATLLIVGDGPLEPSLRSSAVPSSPGRGSPTAAPSHERVCLAGRLPREKLAAVYACASLLVLPSIRTRSFTEPWGLVVNEAMHQGLPVVVSDATGVAAGGLVRHGENGLIVPESDSRALAEAIGRLLKDPDLARRLGEQGHQDIAAFNYDAMTAGFERGLAHALEATH